MPVSVPPPGAHWTVEFADILKPFPEGKIANVTFKVIRFLYPAYAYGGMNIITVVNDPQPNFALMSLVFGITLVLGFLSYAAYRRKFSVQRPPVNEVQPQQQKEFWDCYGTVDPLLDSSLPSQEVVQANDTSIGQILDRHCQQAEDKEEEVGNVSEEEKPVARPNAGPSGKFVKNIPCQFNMVEENTKIDLKDLIEQIDETVQESNWMQWQYELPAK